MYGDNAPTPPELVTSLQQFTNNLMDRFSFHKINSFIDFSKFVLAGGSVLTYMIENPPHVISSDLDFFYVGQTFDEFFNLFV